MKKTNQHIEIARLFSATDAHILRGLLEVEDIKVFIFNEGYASLTPADALVSGGVKLHVPFEKKEKAEKIVETFFKNLQKENIPKCPNCNSTNLKHDYVEHFKHGVLNLLFFMGGTNASNGVRHYKECLDCGYKL